MSRVDRLKVSLGGAAKRKFPSYASQILVKLKLLHGDILDFGCGYGLDAKTFGWHKYDPFYSPALDLDKYDSIVCINVLNVVSTQNKKSILQDVQSLLDEKGHAYFAIPKIAKSKLSGFARRPNNKVELTLPVCYEDAKIRVYLLTRKEVYGKDFHDLTLSIGEPRKKRFSGESVG